MRVKNPKNKVTRGSGLLEAFLAKKRSHQANQLIPTSYRGGKIADIGCGSYPLFLLNTSFKEKYGFDKVVDTNYSQQLFDKNIHFKHFDMEQNKSIPFENNFFDIVTLLAVFEHLEPEAIERLLEEIYRVLKSEGLFIMTTPAFWTKDLLKGMAQLRLVSSMEIKEHKTHYSIPQIISSLERGGFTKERIQSGYFEFFMNTWARARK